MTLSNELAHGSALMIHRAILGLAAGLVAAFVLYAVPTPANAGATYQGPEVCAECHRAEMAIYEGTKHGESFRSVHKADGAKDLAKAAGGQKNMKKNEVCQTCHYTMVTDPKKDKVKAKAGPSCESCHGASSEWYPIHNDYGGMGVKAEDESAEHMAERAAGAAAAGMLWPSDRYGVASNCMDCHGLAHPDLDPAALAIMLDMGHKTVADWELVRYSQGTVRHRYYPPDMTVNAEMSSAELANLFVVGQAAKLVSATEAASKSDHPKYVEFQSARATTATEALSALSAPEAAALISAPTEANARALVDAIAGVDLSGEVGGLLPDPGSYK
jgi:hypothetical protein